MTERHRSFTLKGSDDTPPTPVTFDLDGTKFTCHAQVPGTVLLRHAKRLTRGETAADELLEIWRDVFDSTRQTEPEIDDQGRPVYETDDAGRTVYDDEGEPVQAVREIPGTSEYDRFLAYCDDPGSQVFVQDLGQILSFVLGELAGRPTPPPSRSQRGRPETNPTSGSDSPDSAPATPTS